MLVNKPVHYTLAFFTVLLSIGLVFSSWGLLTTSTINDFGNQNDFTSNSLLLGSMMGSSVALPEPADTSMQSLSMRTYRRVHTNPRTRSGFGIIRPRQAFPEILQKGETLTVTAEAPAAPVQTVDWSINLTNRYVTYSLPVLMVNYSNGLWQLEGLGHENE